MTVELWVGQEFDRSHERRALQRFWTEMQERFGQSSELYLVLANYSIYGVNQIDLTVLKHKAIIVIELKECAEPFRAKPNGPWRTIPDERVIGSERQRNPFEQVMSYRASWLDFLKDKRRDFLKPNKVGTMPLEHVSAIVAISPRVHPDSDTTDLPNSLWFRLVGLDELSQAVYEETSRGLNFSRQELKVLVEKVLNLRNGYPIVEAFKPSYSHFKESNYPSTAYLDDIRAIKQIIRTNSSLLVLGLSGSGKSNLLRFLVSNPSTQSPDMIFVLIDCNGLDWARGREAIQEEICTQIIEALASQNIGLELHVEEKRSAKHALEFLIRSISGDTLNHLVVIFDRSELLQSELGDLFFNYLRALRDANRRLSYILSGRNLDPEKFGELTDILWNEPHWIGALSLSDATMVIRQQLVRLRITLADEKLNKLLRCVGRHSALLKLACELVKIRKINLNDKDSDIIEHLLAARAVQRQCREIWQDLTQVEIADISVQDALRRMAWAKNLPSPPATEWLLCCGLLQRSENNKLEFTSPLFKKYVIELGPPLTEENWTE